MKRILPLATGALAVLIGGSMLNAGHTFAQPMNSPAPRYFFALGDGPRFGAVHGAIEQPFGPHASQDGRGHDSDAGMSIAGHRLHAIPVWQAYAAHAPAHASFGPHARPGPVRPPLAIWGR